MKIKIITTIVLAAILSVLPINAQDVFPLSGAKWTEVEIWTHDNFPDSYRYYSFLQQGDTIIDDILRSKLYYIPEINRKDSVIMGYIHIQGSTVFYRGEYPYYAYDRLCINDEYYYKQDYPLYDFSLSMGNSFLDCIWSFPGSDEKYYRVSDIDAVNLGGISRKRITFIHDNWGEYIADQWIEGMGSVNGLFYGKATHPLSVRSELICFTQNDELIYLNPRYSECPIPKFNAIQEVRTNPLRIFPNPMKSATTVQSDYPLQLIEIYDISGVLLHKQLCKGELQTVINRQSLLQGTHFIKVTLQTGETLIEKLIIQ